MKKQFSALYLIIFCLFPQTVLASPVINEFSSGSSDDWVEIHNPGSETIDLSLYRLRDLTSTNKLDLYGNILPLGFISFDWSNKLNNGGDLIRLLLSSDETVSDQVSYGDQGGLGAPSASQSVGRQPDGSANWISFSSASKGSTNNSSQILAPPILTPTKGPSPTKSPSPSKAPTASKNMTTAKTPTPTKIVSGNSPVPLQGSSLISTAIKKDNSAKISQNLKIDKDFARIRNISPVLSKNPEVKVLAASDHSFSYLITIGGLIILIAAGYSIAARYFGLKELYEKIFNK